MFNLQVYWDWEQIHKLYQQYIKEIEEFHVKSKEIVEMSKKIDKISQDVPKNIKLNIGGTIFTNNAWNLDQRTRTFVFHHVFRVMELGEYFFDHDPQ